MTTRGKKAKVAFTDDDVRLVRLVGELWDRAFERLSPESKKMSDFPRIAAALEAEVKGLPLQTQDPLGGFRPGDGGIVKASIPLAASPSEAAAMRDLAKRLNAHIPKKLVFKNPDGSSLSITAHTASFKQGKRRRK